ncbi:hypothetical protein ACW4TU_45320 (plasmid) [Streptomyces sp. QTS52]
MQAAQQKSWYATSELGPVVLRHREVSELSRHRGLVHAGRQQLNLTGIESSFADEWFGSLLINSLTVTSQTGNHDGLRRLIGHAFKCEPFTPSFVQKIARELAEEIAVSPECEFLKDFATPLTDRMIAAMLGVSMADYAPIAQCARDLSLVHDLSLDNVVTKVNEAAMQLNLYLTDLAEQRRRRPGWDAVSVLVSKSPDAATTLRALMSLVIGFEALRLQFANSVIAFAYHPQQWQSLAGNPELADAASAETLRWIPGAPLQIRFATEDIEYQGMNLAVGSPVILCSLQANRDGSDGGHEFDILTKRHQSHLSFSMGPHHCMASKTSFSHVSEALSELTATLGTPEIMEPISWRAPSGLHGPDRLMLRFAARP